MAQRENAVAKESQSRRERERKRKRKEFIKEYN